MASADLDHIRALLIAQTAEPEPESRGLFSRLLAARRERRPPPPVPAPRSAVRPFPADAANEVEAFDLDQALLLEQIVGPPLAIETNSPLPPPPARNGFGRRSDAAAESELTLDQPMAAGQRLQVLDPHGQAIGEMILNPEVPSLHLIGAARDDAHAVPYFPEDLFDGPPFGEAQPMRPWIKALRNSGTPRTEPAPVRVAPPVAPAAEPALPPAKTKKRRGAAKSKRDAAPEQPISPPLPPTPGAIEPRLELARDLLGALALALTREHETLSDRLLAVASEGLFQPQTAQLA